MRAWALMLGGVLVWTADFFLLYGVASIFPTSPAARTLALAISAAALIIDGWLLWHSSRVWRATRDPYRRWMAKLGVLVAGTSTIAVLWLALVPAVA